MNIVERLARKADTAQQGVRPIAFAVGVFKKFGDDRGGSLAALLAFYGFLSLFPLLLLLVTILGFFSGSEHSFVQRVENSAFSQFPVAGTKLSSNIHGLQGRSIFGLIVGILFVLWGSQGALQTAQYAQAEIWNIPGVNRPNFWARLGRTGLMMLVLGLFLLASTVLAGVVTIGHHGAWAVVGAVVVSLIVNVGLFVVAFRLLTPKQIPWKDMVPGAMVGAVGWTVLQYLGGDPGRTLTAQHQQGVRDLRTRSGPHQLSVPGSPGHPVRRRGQCGAGPAPVAEGHGPTSSHRGGQGGPVVHRARREAQARAVRVDGLSR